MPGTPAPFINPALGPTGTPLVQGMQSHRQQLRDVAGQAQQGNLYDRYGNTVEVSGSNLNQVVSIGAAFQQGGVEVSTGIANGTAGRATQQNTAIGTITLDGTSIGTLGTPASGVFAAGMQIGASITDPTTGVITDAITPGTSIKAVVGSTVELSAEATEAGTAYCAACNWVLSEPGAWQVLTLLLPSPISAAVGYYPPAARLVSGDTVEFRGAITTSSDGTWINATLATLPDAMIPASYVQMGPTWEVDGTSLRLTATLAAGENVGLDGISYALF